MNLLPYIISTLYALVVVAALFDYPRPKCAPESSCFDGHHGDW